MPQLSLYSKKVDASASAAGSSSNCVEYVDKK